MGAMNDHRSGKVRLSPGERHFIAIQDAEVQGLYDEESDDGAPPAAGLAPGVVEEDRRRGSA